jgi:hypothetical protein
VLHAIHRIENPQPLYDVADDIVSAQYYQVVIGLFRPLSTTAPIDLPTNPSSPAQRTPKEIVYEAKVTLETILRLYYMRHGFQFHDPWVTSSMTFIGNIIIDDLAAETAHDPKTLDYLRSTLILAAQGVQKQGKHHHVGTLVSIQLQSRMSASDLQLVRTYVSPTGANNTDAALIVEHSHSQWPIPIVRPNSSVDELRLGHLVKGYEEISLEPEDV